MNAASNLMSIPLMFAKIADIISAMIVCPNAAMKTKKTTTAGAVIATI